MAIGVRIELTAVSLGNKEPSVDFYRAHYYDPVLTRLISSDPIRLVDGLNTYAGMGTVR